MAKTDEIVEVQQLLARYAFALDSHDAEGEADCYTRDGVHASPVQNTQGREALVDAAKQRHAGTPAGTQSRHLIINPLIQLDGDNGTVRAYYMGVANKSGVVNVHNSGEYHIKVRREDGQWKLAERAVAIDGQSNAEVAAKYGQAAR